MATEPSRGGERLNEFLPNSQPPKSQIKIKNSQEAQQNKTNQQILILRTRQDKSPKLHKTHNPQKTKTTQFSQFEIKFPTHRPNSQIESPGNKNKTHPLQIKKERHLPNQSPKNWAGLFEETLKGTNCHKFSMKFSQIF